MGESLRADVLIVNHHTTAETIRLVRALRAEDSHSRLSVLILENGSGPDASRELKKCEGPVTVLVSPDNLGFAAGVNALLPHGRARWLLLINPDVEPASGLFTLLPDRLPEDPCVAIRGGVRAGEGPRSFGRFPGLFDRLKRADDPPAGRAPFRVDWVSGCFMLVRRAVLDELGGFDPGYFQQLEDVDLCWRARESGYRADVDPLLRFVHRGHLSYERTGRDLTRDYRRSKERLLSRHRGRLVAWLYRLAAGVVPPGGCR